MTRDMLRVNSHTEPLLPEDTLHYAPALPRRHRVLRRATWWIFGLAVGTFAIVWGWRAANQLHYLWLQHQLMTCEFPDGPTRITHDGVVSNAVAWPPASKILGLTSSPLPVFTHELVAQNGALRLVVVYGLPRMAGWTGFSAEFEVTARVYAPAQLAAGSRMRLISSASFAHRPFSFHSGRLDQTDRSHFTIAYETDRGSGTIDGWLMNDDTIKLEVRDGPLR